MLKIEGIGRTARGKPFVICTWYTVRFCAAPLVYRPEVLSIMMFGLFFGDWTLLIVLPAMLFAFWAQIRVNSTFAKYSKTTTHSGISAEQAARRLLDENGLSYVSINRIAGNLTDHYDPSSRVLRLSSGVYDGTDVAALGVAAHEVGHAIQHNRGYAPLSIRNGFYPLCAIGDQFGPYLVLIGIMIGGAGSFSYYIMMAGIILFVFAVFFSLVTLPVEFDASSRAIKILDKGGFLDQEELDGAKKVLSAAALTYVAAAVSAILTLLRLLMLAQRRRD